MREGLFWPWHSARDGGTVERFGERVQVDAPIGHLPCQHQEVHAQGAVGIDFGEIEEDEVGFGGALGDEAVEDNWHLQGKGGRRVEQGVAVDERDRRSVSRLHLFDPDGAGGVELRHDPIDEDVLVGLHLELEHLLFADLQSGDVRRKDLQGVSLTGDRSDHDASVLVSAAGAASCDQKKSQHEHGCSNGFLHGFSSLIGVCDDEEKRTMLFSSHRRHISDNKCLFSQISSGCHNPPVSLAGGLEFDMESSCQAFETLVGPWMGTPSGRSRAPPEVVPAMSNRIIWRLLARVKFTTSA